MADKENINKIPSNEPSESYVTEGITLNCTFGDSTVKLQTPGRKSAKINGKLQANITDFKPMVNIPSFGKCSCRGNPTVAAATAANRGVLTPMPCVPNVTMPWINGKEDVMVDGAPPLLETSKNMCLWGGTISIGDKPKKGPNWGRVGEGTTKIANGGLLCWLGVGALAAAGGAGAAICLTTGISDIAEGNQDVAYGMAGSDQPSRNPLKEAIGPDAYYTAEMIGTGLSLAAMAEVPYLSPFAASAGVAEAGAQTAMNRKLASNQKSSPPQPKQKPVKTSALQLEGKVDAVEETKLAENAGTRKRMSAGNNGVGNTGRKTNINPNPFKGKSADEIDAMFRQKRFETRGIDPKNGKGGYVNPKTGRSYYIDKGGQYKKGYEAPHVDVNRDAYNGYNGKLKKKKYIR